MPVQALIPEDDISMWVGQAPPRFGDEPKRFLEHTHFGLTYATMSSDWVGVNGEVLRFADHDSYSQMCILLVTKAGLPLRAFNGGTWEVITFQPYSQPTIDRQWTDYVLPLGWQRAPLPVRIQWPQFLFNTILIAQICWIVVWLPGAVRRRWRLAKDCCLTCGYPSGESRVCPECGRDRSLMRPA